MAIVRAVHDGNSQNSAEWKLLEQCRMATLRVERYGNYKSTQLFWAFILVGGGPVINGGYPV